MTRHKSKSRFDINVIGNVKELSKTEGNSDRKDKLIEKKEVLEAELQRAMAAANAKKAHKEIEDIDRARKRPAMKSICERLDYMTAPMNFAIQKITELGNKNQNVLSVPLSPEVPSWFTWFVQTYESIRRDIQITMEISEADMNQLFPRLTFNAETFNSLASSVLNIGTQLEQMRIYCKRLLD